MFEYFKTLASDYNLSLENVLSIALNRYGVLIDGYDDDRVRFNLKFNNSIKEDFFALCVNTYKDSPFKLVDNTIYLKDEKIAEITNLERDTCTSTYFRNNKRDITFNSNSRSKCAGCTFCGTYSLSEDDDYDFSNKESIKKYFDKLLKENKVKSLEYINSITLCTGCFESEDDLYNHILLLNSTFKDMGFKGSINYIGSQLRDYEKIKSLKDEVGNFGLYLTIEKFIDREKFMRPEKASLKLNDAKDLLNYSSSIGINSTFLYILGLEDLDAIKYYFNYFKDSINKFPIVQIFQDYVPIQENYRHESAKEVEYYLKAKKIINDTFSDTSLRPKLWENFRSLYYENPEKEFVKCKK